MPLRNLGAKANLRSLWGFQKYKEPGHKLNKELQTWHIIKSWDRN